jgi:membrane protease subunit (stomatin/prohibitin family)
LDVYKIERSFDTTEKAAENMGGGEGSAGGILGTMVGIGMAQPIANTMTGLMSNAIQNTQQPPAPANISKGDILKLLRELGDLKAADILTDEEFTAKKKELLAKI